MHVLKLKLRTTADDELEIERRFRAMWHIHNVLVKHARELLAAIDENGEYQAMRREYAPLARKGDAATNAEKERRKALAEDMAAIRKECGLSEAGFQMYIKVCARQFKILCLQHRTGIATNHRAVHSTSRLKSGVSPHRKGVGFYR